MPVRNRFAELLPDITGWHRDFHIHPALLFDVHRTAAKVADLCRSFGCDEVIEGIGRTGVAAVIKGRKKWLWPGNRVARRYGCFADQRADRGRLCVDHPWQDARLWA